MPPKHFVPHLRCSALPHQGTAFAYGVVLLLLLPGYGLHAQQNSRRTSASAQAPDSIAAPKQPDVRRRNVLKLSPLIVVGSLSTFYERALTDRVSVVVGYGSVVSGGGFRRPLKQDKSDYLLERGTVEVRHYWKRNGLQSWYAGTYLRAGTLRESYSVYLPPGPPGPVAWQTQQARLWTPGALLGYQLLTRWVALDAFMGLQKTLGGESWGRHNDFADTMSGRASFLRPRVGLCIGVPF